GNSHTIPSETSKLVWRVFEDAATTKVQTESPTREANLLVKPFIDLMSKGHHQLISPALKKFNQRMQAFKQGGAFEADEDEMPPAEF
ncbi:hypothetical protein C8J56DRAFT_723826, partial [Mycena floridula]